MPEFTGRRQGSAQVAGDRSEFLRRGCLTCTESQDLVTIRDRMLTARVRTSVGMPLQEIEQ